MLLPLLALLPTTMVFYAYLLCVACHVYAARSLGTLLALVLEMLPSLMALLLDALTGGAQVDSSFPPDSVYYSLERHGWRAGGLGPGGSSTTATVGEKAPGAGSHP